MLSFQNVQHVARVDHKDLSFHDFFTKYALTSTPVIITGLKLTEKIWTLQHIKSIAGHLEL